MTGADLLRVVLATHLAFLVCVDPIHYGSARQSALAFTVLMMRLVLDGRPLHPVCSALRFHLNPLSAKLRMCAPIAVFSGRLDKLLPPPQHPVGYVIGFSLLRHKRIINTACFFT